MKTKECPNCHQPNVANALACAYCGSRFSKEKTRTVALPEGLVGVSRLEHVEHLMRLHQHGLIFFPAHSEHPIIVDNPSQPITLGRTSPNEDSAPVIDLEAYGAVQLGISRNHVRVQRTPDGCTIEDLNSKNGTWLNGARLEPHVAHVLRSGDEMRLGHLILHVYFEMPTVAAKTVFFVNTLHDTGTVTRHRLSVHDLTVGLSPFLRAMGDGQNLINELQELTQSDVGINAITTNPQSRTISVTLDGANTIIALLMNQVLPWKKEHHALIESKGENLQSELKALSLRILEEIKPGLDTEMQKKYGQQWLPILQTFMFSAFEMMVEEPIPES